MAIAHGAHRPARSTPGPCGPEAARGLRRRRSSTGPRGPGTIWTVSSGRRRARPRRAPRLLARRGRCRPLARRRHRPARAPARPGDEPDHQIELVTAAGEIVRSDADQDPSCGRPRAAAAATAASAARSSPRCTRVERAYAGPAARAAGAPARGASPPGWRHRGRAGCRHVDRRDPAPELFGRCGRSARRWTRLPPSRPLSSLGCAGIAAGSRPGSASAPSSTSSRPRRLTSSAR
jgi:hypothetical protein